jgi:DNA-binding PadR family transcriptional regulator
MRTMRHRHSDTSHEDFPDRPHRGRHHGRHRRGRRGGRPFDYGEIRLLLLAMIAEQPSHGYELIKAIEDRFGGRYSPSPGVIYPTLAWLDDMGYAAIEAEEGGRKRYRITAEGEAFLLANREAADALLARIDDAPEPTPAPVVRAMENLKLALRLRLERGPIEPATTETIAAALDAAAHTVENS